MDIRLIALPPYPSRGIVVEKGSLAGDPSQRTLRISAAGSRFAHARKAPQVKPRWADGTARAKCVGVLRQAQDKLR